MNDDNDDIEQSAAPLIEHLTELRNRLIRSVVAFAICMIFAFTIASQIFNFLANPIVNILKMNGQAPDLIFTGLQQGFMVNIRISLFGGFILSFPYISFQLWQFVAPGLYKNEKRALLPYLIATPVLFIFGGLLVYYLVMPLAIEFFLSFESVANSGSIAIQLEAKVNEYLSLIMRLIFAFGISFQLPVILSLLARINVIDSIYLKKRRKYVIVIIFAVAALLTPPDPITQIGLALPLLILYELSIFVVKFIEKGKNA